MNSGGGTAAVGGRPLVSAVKANEKRCEPLGDGKVGDEAVTRYSMRAEKPGNDPFAIYFWISQSTGLQTYHGMGSNAGLRWVSGSAVVMPTGAPK